MSDVPVAADPHALKSHLIAAAPDLDLTFRPMFGGIMAYSAGKVFASLSNIGLALKLSGTDHAAFAALGAVRLRYEPDSPPSKSYLMVPAAVLADTAALAHWATLSANAAKPKPTPKPPRKRSA